MSNETNGMPERPSAGGMVMCPNCSHEFMGGETEGDDPFAYLDDDEGGPGKTVTESFTEALQRHRMKR